jgi:hypothetical protein
MRIELTCLCGCRVIFEGNDCDYTIRTLSKEWQVQHEPCLKEQQERCQPEPKKEGEL